MASDWERRKEYLIRSMFQDLSVPSTIPEYDESRSSDSSWSPPPTYKKRSPVSAPSQRLSPLPDLIIEREPNRHDEPEEFYKQLETKILKTYKKLFGYNKSLHFNDSITSHEDFNDQDDIAEANEIAEMVSNIEEVSDDIENNEVIRRTRSPESYVSQSTYRSSGIYHEIVEVTADIHQENNLEESNHVSEPSNNHVPNNSKSRRQEIFENLSVGSDNDEKLERQQETSLEVKSTSGEHEIEVMRSRRSTLSVGSIQQRSDSSSSNHNPRIEEGDRSFMMEAQESCETNIDMEEDFSAPNLSSTPVKRKQTDFTEAPSLSKQQKVKHVSVQTTASDYFEMKGLDWKNLRRKFFFGIPKVYKLVLAD